jgi:D-alanyl-D-alanine carboxypeptidase/D-alanyl-D-alanine-endopeptidase (penicillin-binding protein 4)
MAVRTLLPSVARMKLRCAARLMGFLVGGGLACVAQAQTLPPEVEAALVRAKVPRDAVSHAGGGCPRAKPGAPESPRPGAHESGLGHEAGDHFAALDLAGARLHLEHTGLLTAAVRDGTLYGNL